MDLISYLSSANSPATSASQTIWLPGWLDAINSSTILYS